MRQDATSLRTQQGHPLARQVHHHLRSFLAPLLPTPATWMRPLGVRRQTEHGSGENSLGRGVAAPHRFRSPVAISVASPRCYTAS